MEAIRKRLISWGAVGLVLAAVIVYTLLPKPVAVDLVTLASAPMQVTLDEEGETRVHDTFGLSAPVSGRMQRIKAAVGDRVVAGETLLASIQPVDPTLLDYRTEAEARAALQAAESALALSQSEVEQAQAEFEFASAEHTRARDLLSQGMIPVREADMAERAFRTTRAALATAHAAMQVRSFEVERVRARLVSPADTHNNPVDACKCVQVVAPVDGQVLRIPDRSERVVNAGQLLMEIGDSTALEIVADFRSTEAVRIEPGQTVLIERWGGDKALTGRVQRVEPYGFTKVSALGIEEQRVNVVIDFVSPFEEWQRLGHGYQVEVRVVLWEGDKVIAVPLTALFRQGDAWAVIVNDDGVARVRTVEVGHRNGVFVQVTNGLVSGEQVVRYVSERVTEGARLAVLQD